MNMRTMFATYDNPMLVVDSADFDGAADYMTRGAALSGIADSKTGTLSLWVRIDGGDGGTRRILSCATVQSCQLNMSSTDQFEIIGQNSTPTNILRGLSSSAYTADGSTWYHLAISWNLAVAGSGRFYINGASAGSFVTYTDDTINYAGSTNWSVGGATNGAALFNGCIADVWFAPGVYLDFSNAYYLYKFRSRSGKPVALGSGGALPTGTQPICYFHIGDGEAVANFANNLGTGGNYSITGTLATGSSSPSD